MDFEIIDVADVPGLYVPPPRNRHEFRHALMDLPLGKAILKRSTGAGRGSGLWGSYKRPDEHVVSRWDEAKRGRWYWWEPD